MTGRTVVSVYQVDDEGATGDFLGLAILIGGCSVLAYPELACTLIRLPGDVRVAIRPADGVGIQVIDAEIRVIQEDPPLVIVHLEKTTKAPTEGPPPPSEPISREQAVAALLGYLENTSPPVETRREPRDNLPDFWCRATCSF
jgi:hypothetical protein